MKLSLLARFLPAAYRHTVLIWPLHQRAERMPDGNWKGYQATVGEPGHPAPPSKQSA